MHARPPLFRNFATTFIPLMLLSFTLLGCFHDDDKKDTDDPMGGAPAESITRTAILSGAQETTPVATNATGYGSVVVNRTTRGVTGSITFTGMTATTAHIHTGAAGANGAPAVTLTVDNMTHSATIPAGTVLTQTQYDDLLGGKLYFNVHSSTNAGGEIRGQIGRVVMTAMLDGTQQTPAVTTGAMGTGMVVVDPVTLAITGGATYTGVTATAAHIHTGAAGANGGVAITLTIDNNAGTATIPAGTVLTSAQYDDLRAGKLYFNLHSAANTGGEIRGQIGPVAMIATLNGTQEVPAVTTAASGKAVLVVDPVTRALSGGAGFAGANATTAHIHTGAAGANGAVAVAFMVDSNTNTATVPNSTVLTQTQYDDLLAGNLYVNIHSTTYTSGEIRGQLARP